MFDDKAGPGPSGLLEYRFVILVSTFYVLRLRSSARMRALDGGDARKDRFVRANCLSFFQPPRFNCGSVYLLFNRRGMESHLFSFNCIYAGIILISFNRATSFLSGTHCSCRRAMHRYSARWINVTTCSGIPILCREIKHIEERRRAGTKARHIFPAVSWSPGNLFSRGSL